ncbi:hypothetical protein BP5796_07833 [Coleophoma crateriformis]|uniref:Rhodopsin domain-containing protein n=1 Tax=Coleophoma crateriformis TaxID=565419 RepID=A0A3D8RCM1_9HELO|nr:hypothetical protein BP5796_07833 [Coleophoma crateriformis]
MDLRRKIEVGLILSLGSFGCVVSMVRLKALRTAHFGVSTDTTHDYILPVIWTALELAVAMSCACLPAIRNLWLRMCSRKKASIVSVPTPGTSGSSNPKPRIKPYAGVSTIMDDDNSTLITQPAPSYELDQYVNQPHRHEPEQRVNQPHRHELEQRVNQPHRRELEQRVNQAHRHELDQYVNQRYRHELEQRVHQPHRHELEQRVHQPHRHELEQRVNQPHRHELDQYVNQRHRHDEHGATTQTYTGPSQMTWYRAEEGEVGEIEGNWPIASSPRKSAFSKGESEIHIFPGRI